PRSMCSPRRAARGANNRAGCRPVTPAAPVGPRPSGLTGAGAGAGTDLRRDRYGRLAVIPNATPSTSLRPRLRGLPVRSGGRSNLLPQQRNLHVMVYNFVPGGGEIGANSPPGTVLGLAMNDVT